MRLGFWQRRFDGDRGGVFCNVNPSRTSDSSHVDVTKKTSSLVRLLWTGLQGTLHLRRFCSEIGSHCDRGLTGAQQTQFDARERLEFLYRCWRGVISTIIHLSVHLIIDCWTLGETSRGRSCESIEMRLPSVESVILTLGKDSP